MIDEKLQAQLRAKYNPDGSLLRRHQLRMVEMLKYFDDLCQKHDIKYWLSSGNCLGLVRHGGFIPWDDDLDVEMLREDYLKLEKVFKETDDYVLQTWKSDSGYSHPFAKMRDKHSYMEGRINYDRHYKYKGVFIDIFQLEKSPYSVCRIYYQILWKLIKPLCTSDNFIIGVIFHFLKCIYFHSIPLVRFLFGWFPNNKLRHTYGTGWVNNTRDKKKIFPLQRVQFEGISTNIPNNIESYLQNMYGNYLEIPTDDKIKPHIISVNFLNDNETGISKIVSNSC